MLDPDGFISVDHWRELDLLEWNDRWPNFHPSELCTPDTKALRIYGAFMDALQSIRDEFANPMHITSGFRSVRHNDRVGGVLRSQHVKGRAADIALRKPDHGPWLERLAFKHGMKGIGRYPKKRFIHLDMREGRQAAWGSW